MAAVEPLIIQQLYHMLSLKGLGLNETESWAAKPEFLYPITKTQTTETQLIHTGHTVWAFHSGRPEPNSPWNLPEYSKGQWIV